jgi:acetyl coenzyme A synthetase (ADP forming)-like protein
MSTPPRPPLDVTAPRTELGLPPLAPLFKPRSVAVMGASRQPGSLGAALLHNIRTSFRGPIHAVNAHADSVDGLRAWPTAQAVGETIDLAVIAVPAAAVEAALLDAVKAGVRGAVIISGGFAETSAEGALWQRRLTEIARASNLRLVGPNCMGLLDTDPEAPLNATFVPVFPPAGNVGVMSQSGALGFAVLDYVARLGLGVSSFVSVGNKADVSGNDMLAYWRDDPRTDVIALYLESFGNPRRFARLAPEVARRKPIVAVKSGRSAAGTRAASSHSAALASLDVGIDALFEEAGVIRTDTLEDLFDVVALLATQPLPPGPRVGIVTNAGGPGILLADACAAQGLELPELEAATKVALRRFLPPQATVSNPVDMIASAGAADYEQAIAAVGQDSSVDAVVAVYVPPLATGSDLVAQGIARAASHVPTKKPVLTVFLSTRGTPPELASGPRGKLPSFSFPENAARALGAAVRYARWRSRPQGRHLVLVPRVIEEARGIVQAALPADGEPAWMPATAVDQLLRVIGVRTATARVVDPEAAPQAAAEIGFPVVAKAIAPGLVHRSDQGAVLLDLESPQEVGEAVRTLRARVPGLQSVLLQSQVRGGLEAIVGIVGDPSLGPLVVAGLGGREVELLKDVSFRLAPVTDVDAGAMLDRLRTRPLLDGYRGSPAGDRTALVELIQRVSALADALPEIREMDLNPVKVLPPGQGAVVVDARVRVARSRA